MTLAKVRSEILEEKFISNHTLCQNQIRFFFPKGVNLDVDELHDALVLDYDIEKKRVYLSLDSNIVTKQKDNVTVGKKKVRKCPSMMTIVIFLTLCITLFSFSLNQVRLFLRLCKSSTETILQLFYLNMVSKLRSFLLRL